MDSWLCTVTTTTSFALTSDHLNDNSNDICHHHHLTDLRHYDICHHPTTTKPSPPPWTKTWRWQLSPSLQFWLPPPLHHLHQWQRPWLWFSHNDHNDSMTVTMATATITTMISATMTMNTTAMEHWWRWHRPPTYSTDLSHVYKLQGAIYILSCNYWIHC